MVNRKSNPQNLAVFTCGEVPQALPVCRLTAQNAQLPALPAIPDALAHLRKLLNERFADLRAITEAVRGDVGLTMHAFRLAAENQDAVPPDVLSISEIVVHLGLNNLRTMAFQTPALTEVTQTGIALGSCERFWMHARLTALIAEALPCNCPGVNREDAYVAGLVRHVQSLPFLLDWNFSDDQLENAWKLPALLADVVRGDRNACRTTVSRYLLELANEADKHAFRLELGYY